MKLSAPLMIGVGVGLAAVVGLAWAGRRAVQLVKENVHLVTPTDPRNLAYEGVSAAGRVLADDEGWTLGGWVYDVTHGDDERIAEMLKGAPARPVSGTPPYFPADFGPSP